ncbi:ABC transporter permease [Oceanobacillus jeddahense]|uniref:Transport permease protein n=1 Tax=Oceanobacillus jeddahense TaxID=1462527 RepID=A0ABY5JUT0_9BACI|nr:ABC transporter permease [Oceanobacillus jeddahense]UUI03559.1 ABC transporter permease [Oceanobacillus jeddahense]
MNVIMDSWYMMRRNLSHIVRSPFIIAINLVQPILWMLLFSTVFANIVHMPGFAASSYIDFLSPGIVVMSTLMAGSYAGMGIIADYKQGVLNRFLVTPVHRSFIIIGSLVQNVVTLVIQSFMMIGIALIMGARFEGGISGIALLILCSVLLGIAFGALSIALAITIRKEEGLTSAVAFSTMPLLFMSGLFMPLQFVPGWMQIVASLNPVNWAIEAGRGALTANNDGNILFYIAYLLIFAIIAIYLAVYAFKRYQRSV